MGKNEDKKPFLDYVNGPTKKDPRKSNSYDHDKAFEEIKGQSSPGPKKKFKFEKKGTM